MDGFFAVKTVKISSLEVLSITIREFEVLTKLRHPGVVSVYRLLLDSIPSQAFLVMELIPGDSLRSLLTSGYCFNGNIYSESEIRSVAHQLLSSLAYIHGQGLIHRDVSPANILLSGVEVKLVDFQTVCGSEHPPGQRVVGTAHYQAPEMWEGEFLSEKGDIWSAGAVVRRLAKSAKQTVSLACIDFITICTEPRPERRPSAKEALMHSWFH